MPLKGVNQTFRGAHRGSETRVERSLQNRPEKEKNRFPSNCFPSARGEYSPLSGAKKKRETHCGVEWGEAVSSKMAASGLAGVAKAGALDCKSPRVHLLQLNAIFSGAFDKNLKCGGTDIAKCLERLNGVIPATAIEPYLKASLAQKFNGYNYRRENFPASRLGRSPSTDRLVKVFLSLL